MRDVTACKGTEEGLAAAERHLEAHLDNSPVAVIELDSELRIIRWAGGAERLFGWGAAEATGRRVFDLLWDQGGETDSIREVLADRRGNQTARTRSTHRNCRKDGSIVHCIWSSSVLYDAEGRLTSVLALVLDSTERTEGEDALRLTSSAAIHRPAGLEAVLQAVPAAVWIAHDPECLSITGNRTADDWLRLPPGAQTSLTAPEGARPTHFGVFQDGRELRGEELPVQRAARGAVVQDVELEVRLSDGGVRFVLGNATPLLDERGQPYGAVAAFVDITARKRAEEALQRQVGLNEYYLDTVQTLIVALDTEGRITMINRMGCEILGYARHELLGRHWFANYLPQPEGMERVYPVFQRIMAGELGALEYYENPVRCRDGRLRLIAWHNASLTDTTGRMTGILSSGEDITERRHAEEALREADRRKDEFLAVLAHELRNPLAPMRNALEILKLGGSPGPAVEKAQDLIERQLAQLVRLIDDLMDRGRINSGKLHLRKEPVDLATLLEQTVETIEPKIARAGQGLHLSLPRGSVYVDGDPVRLGQVFLNLLDNACKYTGIGGSISLTAERDRNEVEIRVEDTGVGIAPEDLKRLFQMFSRVGTPAGDGQDGLGIGLALARGLVEMHGGRIEARSEGLGRGSSLIVRLPALAEPPATAASQRKGWNSTEPTAPLRILIADDNRDAVESLALLLELTGYNVERAYDGLEAVAVAEHYRPDLVLLDIGMPKLDGYEACRRIREQPWGHDMLIVALTGWGQEDDRRRSQGAGFDHHLLKPVARSDLLRLLALWQAERAAAGVDNPRSDAGSPDLVGMSPRPDPRPDP